MKWLVLILASAISSCGGCSGASLEGDASTVDSPLDTRIPDTHAEEQPDTGPDPIVDTYEDPGDDFEELPSGHYWSRTYGTDGGWEEAEAVIELAGGGFVIAGSYSSSGVDFWIIGIDELGAIRWQRGYGGRARGVSICPTADGGFAAAVGDRIARLDRGGGVAWQKRYFGTPTPEFVSVIEVSDGGLAAVGTTREEETTPLVLNVLRLDATGEPVWQLAFGAEGEDEGADIAETADGGLIAVGTQGFRDDDHDALVIRLDPSGLMAWRRSYGGEGLDSARAVVATEDGGAIVSGYRMIGSGAPLHFWATRIDGDGEIVWHTELEGTYYDFLNGMDVTEDGGCVLTGERRDDSVPGEPRTDAWVVKLDREGEILWQRSYGGSRDSEALSILQTSDGALMVAGWTFSFDLISGQAWVLRMRDSGLVALSCESTVGAPTAAERVEPGFEVSVASIVFHETHLFSVSEDFSGYETHATSSLLCGM